MELVPIKINQGEEKAWQELCGLPSAQICRDTGAVFDHKRAAYILRCFGIDFLVNPCEIHLRLSDVLWFNLLCSYA